MRALRGGLAALCAAVILTGCGQSEQDKVRAKVNQFLKATAGKDYKTLCTQVLAPALVNKLRSGGIQCEQAMQIALQGLKNPGLSIGRVQVHGATASVITLTTATGQQASLDAIELVNTGGGWRVSSLGTPVVK